MPRLSILVYIGCLVVAPAFAQRYLGAAACAECHPAQAASHQGTPHALALSRAAQHRLINNFAASPPVARKPDYHFSFRLDGERLLTAAAGPDDRLEAELEWAFGAGGQGVTFVSQASPAWYLELAMSYFPAAGRFAATPGHDHRPQNLEQALGILYPADRSENGIVGCFACHSTGPVQVTEAGVVPRELGVQCESCHGPGGDHVTAIRLDEPEAARRSIVNPGDLSPAEVSVQCGTCHRPPGSADARNIDWGDPWNVRHAPPYLQRSKCFQSGGLSCLTCHPAHQPAAAVDINAQCGTCHSSPNHTTTPATSGCTTCHMPKAQPHPFLTFTNHEIAAPRK